jgi:hypothetical protein
MNRTVKNIFKEKISKTLKTNIFESKFSFGT